MRQVMHAGLVVVSAAAIAGCVNVDFKEPVTSFASSMALSNATLLAYYSELNSLERELYLQRVAENPTMEVLEVDPEGHPTGLIAQFSPQSIKARTDAVALLSKYGERLAALAGADASTRFSTGTQTLGANLTTLDSTFRALGVSSDAGTTASKDATAANYAAPVATIIGLIGERYLDSQRDAALTRAVREGEPAVNAILDLLDRDFTTMIGPLQATGQEQALTGMMVAYNHGRAQMDYDQRRAALDRINIAAARYENTIAHQPSSVIAGIRDAHTALVNYANSSREPEDLAALVAALETFNNRIKPLADAVARIQELNRG